MIYEVKTRINSEQLKGFHFQNDAIVKPVYKKFCDDQEKDWILAHADSIGKGVVAESIYNLYLDDYIDREVVTKTKFYRACRDILELEMKSIRIENEIHYCFV